MNTLNRTPRFLLAACLAAVVAATPAFAQPGDRGNRGGNRGGGGFMGRMMQPEYMRRDMPLIVENLSLDKQQATIVETMLLDYEAAFAEASEQMRDRFTELRPQREATPEQREQRETMRNEMRAIRDEIRAVRAATPEGQPVNEEAMTKLRERMEANRVKFEEMRPRIDPDERQAMMESFRELGRTWRQESSVLNAQFVADLQVILTPEQMADYWPSFERTMRRQKTIERGQLSGESVDIFLVLREAGINPNATESLGSLLDGYEIELDRALVARNEYLDNGRDPIFDAMTDNDIDLAIRLMEDEKALRVAVRNVNERYAGAMTADLAEHGTPAQLESFQSGFRRRAYDRIYRTTAMQRTFDAAMELEGISDDILVQIISLHDGYLGALEARNAQILSTVRAEEPAEITDRARRMAERFSGEGRDGQRGQRGQRGGPQEDNPIREAFNKRQEMDESYRAQLEALLTPEQIAALPPMRRDRGGGGGGNMSEEQREQFRARMVEQFDKDGDGELSDEEREAARAQWRGRGGDRQGGPGGNRQGGRRGGGQGGGQGGGNDEPF